MNGTITDGEGSYGQLARCSWIVNVTALNTDTHQHALKLTFVNFTVSYATRILLANSQIAQTECLWDYLYVYDGYSAYAPQRIALSGAVSQQNAYSKNKPRSLTITSGVALIHFAADMALLLDGFDITYEYVCVKLRWDYSKDMHLRPNDRLFFSYNRKEFRLKKTISCFVLSNLRMFSEWHFISEFSLARSIAVSMACASSVNRPLAVCPSNQYLTANALTAIRADFVRCTSASTP